MKQVFEELKNRGFCFQFTDEEEVKKLMNGDEPVKFYIGFDPTGSSLHVGHLLPVMAMRIMQKAGHVPLVLVGGATARIGDPSGKQTARPMMTIDEINYNVKCLQSQLAHFIKVENGEAIFVNNADWLCSIPYIDMLREVGPIFSVNRMLTQESVKMRLETGLSFLEFNYSILQAYDFMTLNQTHNCVLQMGGQDQWGNMVSGTELIRRKNGKTAHCMTIPLLLDSTGKKFGKTSGGKNVWLDPERTSAFDYYQFWRNCDDSQVRQLMLYFTDLPIDEIERLCDPEGNVNRAKEILACEATAMARGEQAAREAFAAAGSRFGFADPEGKIATSSTVSRPVSAQEAELPGLAIKKAELENGVMICQILVQSGICKSNSDGRRLIQGGAVSINGSKISDPAALLKLEDFASGSADLKSGKKNFRRLTIEE